MVYLVGIHVCVLDNGVFINSVFGDAVCSCTSACMCVCVCVCVCVCICVCANVVMVG